MNRYASAVVLCWLLAVPVLLSASDPAPPPRPVPDLVASAAVAERLLMKEYGADAKGVKGAKVKFAFRATTPDAESETGEIREMFAIAAEEVSYSGDGLVTLKNARYVQHHYFPHVFDGKKYYGWKATNQEPTQIRLQYAGPVRGLEDIHKAQLRRVEFPGVTTSYENAAVELVAR